jgi:hypothetical protein
MENSNRIARAGGGLLVVALALLTVGRSAWGTRLDSFTADEPWHVVAGVAYLRHGDFALNPEQPPLIKLWTAAWMPEDFRVPPAPVLREKGSEREWSRTPCTATTTTYERWRFSPSSPPSARIFRS